MKTTGNMIAAIRSLAAVLALLLAASFLPAAAVAQDVVKPLKAGRLAVSFAYQFELLDAALQRSVSKYGPYNEEPYLETMSAGRDQIEGPRGEFINLLIANVGVAALDDGMIHVPVPLDRGLLGTRISFIRADKQAERENYPGKHLQSPLRIFLVIARPEILSASIWFHRGPMTG